MAVLVLAVGARAMAAEPTANGARLFADNCAACHQASGQGVSGAFPALKGNRFVTGAPNPLASTILNGRGGMPNFKSAMTDAELAAVASYIRSSWGNKAAPIPASTFKTLRTSAVVKGRPVPIH
jgi:mono/diheme cytochrome c family protein